MSNVPKPFTTFYTSYYTNDIAYTLLHKKCIAKMREITRRYPCVGFRHTRSAVDGSQNKRFVKVQSYVFLLSHFGRLIVVRYTFVVNGLLK